MGGRWETSSVVTRFNILYKPFFVLHSNADKHPKGGPHVACTIYLIGLMLVERNFSGIQVGMVAHATLAQMGRRQVGQK